MTALIDVSTHLPGRVTVASLQAELGLGDAQLRRLHRFYGLREVARSDESEVDSLLTAVGKLAAFAGAEHRVRYLVRAKTMPISAPYPSDPLRTVRDALGLGHAHTFTVTDHACASGLLAVDLCGTLLAADGDPDALALILVGEKAFTHDARIIPDIAVLGEGVAAVLLGPADGPDRLLGYASRTYADAGGPVQLTPAAAAEFRARYPRALGEVLHGACATAGLTLADIDLVLPHNVNRVSWLRAAEDIGLDRDRVFLDNVAVTGHCFCADPFLNYRSARDLGLLRPGGTYLMVSVGLGTTFSALVFRH